MKKAIPGTCGWPIVGDKSIQFYSDPDAFVKGGLEQHQSNIFQTRILNHPSVFLCGYSEVKELLNERSTDFENGYHTFLFNSYGTNILFMNGKPANELHDKLTGIFSKNDLFMETVQRSVINFVNKLTTGSDSIVDVYSACKTAMTQMCLSIFLDLNNDDDTELIETISSLTTLHWHGIISLPLNLKVPFGKSGWNRALEAKSKLIQLIREKLKTNVTTQHDKKPRSFFNEMYSQFSSTELENHLLLFISALIPKAFASLYTSFIYELAGNEKLKHRQHCLKSEVYLHNVLLEIQRLYPPFIGGRRIAKTDTSLGSYKIPKGYSVFYMAQYAHRDKEAFKNPNMFFPERWTGCDQNLFCFGNGKRQCIGTHLIMKILTFAAQETLRKTEWELADSQAVVYKFLPVSRPKDPLLVGFKQAAHSHCDD